MRKKSVASEQVAVAPQTSTVSLSRIS